MLMTKHKLCSCCSAFSYDKTLSCLMRFSVWLMTKHKEWLCFRRFLYQNICVSTIIRHCPMTKHMCHWFSAFSDDKHVCCSRSSAFDMFLWQNCMFCLMVFGVVCLPNIDVFIVMTQHNFVYGFGVFSGDKHRFADLGRRFLMTKQTCVFHVFSA